MDYRKLRIIWLVVLLGLTPLFAHAKSKMPGVSSCAYWDRGGANWFVNARSLGFGVFPVIIDKEVSTAEVSLWVEPDGQWAAIVTRILEDEQFGPLRWSCIVARGVGWKTTPHLAATSY
jgi:hypothetical protein